MVPYHLFSEPDQPVPYDQVIDGSGRQPETFGRWHVTAQEVAGKEREDRQLEIPYHLPYKWYLQNNRWLFGKEFENLIATKFDGVKSRIEGS